MSGEKQYNEIETSWVASVVYHVSDLSRYSAWPLRILTICGFLCSGIIWIAKNDWKRHINEKDIAYLTTLSRITDTVSFVLVVILIVTVIVTILTFILLVRIAFGNDFSKTIREATRDLLLNSFFFAFSLFFLMPSVAELKHSADGIAKIAEKKIQCARRMEKLGVVLRHYAADNHHWYPYPNQWCDLLKKNGEFNDFGCLSADRCRYALNPSAEPLSRFKNWESYWDAYGSNILTNDRLDSKTRVKILLKATQDMTAKRRIAPTIVLLFECREGWNQNGGVELLDTNHHDGKGCNILFNDGTVKFISTEDFYKLRWGDDSNTD